MRNLTTFRNFPILMVFVNAIYIQAILAEESLVTEDARPLVSEEASSGDTDVEDKELYSNIFEIGSSSSDWEPSLEEVCGFPDVAKSIQSRIVEKKKRFSIGQVQPTKVLWSVGGALLNAIGGYMFETVAYGIFQSMGLNAHQWSSGNYLSWLKRPARFLFGTEENLKRGLTRVDDGGALGRTNINPIGTYQESKLSQVEALQLVHAELMQDSAPIVSDLPIDFQQQIQALDDRITQDLNAQQAEPALKKMLRREEIYLAFPHPNDVMQIAQYGKSGNRACRARIDRNVKELIRAYPSENRENLKILTQEIRDNSLLNQTHPVLAYLYGPPGTGKTMFVERLASTLHLGLCKINLNNIESMQDLLGSDYPDEWGSLEANKVLGQIGNCLIRSTHRNLIIFFDEAGAVLGDLSGGFERGGGDYSSMKKQMIQEQLKKLLDPGNQHFAFNALGVSFPIDRMTFILAGNYPITNPAMASRVKQLVFGRLGLSQKRNVVEKTFKKSIQDFYSILSVEEVTKIADITRAFLPFIINEDEKRNPGARIIQYVTEEFMNYVRTLVMDAELTGDSLLDVERLKDFILKSFKLREKPVELPTYPKYR